MQLIPFEAPSSPALDNALNAIAALFADVGNDLVGNNASGFPSVSIKGKSFHIVRGGDRELVSRPDEPGVPAPYIDVVIVRANPNRSKVYYADGYTEGGDDKPLCKSVDGITPDPDAQEKQCATCAACPHNVWGSKVSESGQPGRACADMRRIAIAMPSAPNDPMLLRVPAASMKGMTEYGKLLATRNVRFEAVVTRVGFDYSVAHPQLTFKPVGMIADKDALKAILEARDLDVTKQIVGVREDGAAPAPAPVAAAPAPQVAAAPAAAPAEPPPVRATPPARAARSKPVAQPATTEQAAEVAVATAAQTPKVDVPVEVVAAAPAPAPAAGPLVPVDLGAEIESMLGDLNFDD